VRPLSHHFFSSHSNTHNIIVDGNNIQLPAHFKVMLTEQLSNMVSCDIVPFSVVENAGFRDVLDMILKAG
jgi:rRNA-processing protein FCF1